jgi:hypothetical protein
MSHAVRQRSSSTTIPATIVPFNTVASIRGKSMQDRFVNGIRSALGVETTKCGNVAAR